MGDTATMGAPEALSAARTPGSLRMGSTLTKGLEGQMMMELLGGEVQAIVICPSNPFVSVDPILKLPGVRAALKASGAPIVAVSPIIGGQAVKGPAAKMMAELRVPVNARGVAAYYGNLLDGMVIDQQDASLANAVAATGVQVEVAQTVMNSIQDSCMLADTVLNFARKIAG